ncbi:hypothetical protein C8R44DRAFT_986790 [Mycena epipterygia]|nr:hypothetical protein C8R44DRAFT_986790 [Mycena epipterygia]
MSTFSQDDPVLTVVQLGGSGRTKHWWSRLTGVKKHWGKSNAKSDPNNALFYANPESPTLDELRKAVALSVSNPVDYPFFLHSLAIALNTRYETTGELQDLQDAIENFQAALDVAPADAIDASALLQNFAAVLLARYRVLDDSKDLNAALKHWQAAAKLVPLNNPEHLGVLGGIFRSTFQSRYYKSRNLKDLESALEAKQATVELVASDDPNLADYLKDLAISLMDYYYAVEDRQDLDTALQHSQKALELVANNHDHAQLLRLTSTIFLARFRVLDDLGDLEDAVNSAEAAIGLLPEDDPLLAGCLITSAVSLRDRYQRLGNRDDLTKSLEMGQKAQGVFYYATKYQEIWGL